MANYFEVFANKLNDLGVFQYLLPFILVSAITYAMFRKTKILGDSAFINGVVALSMAFMVVFGFPIATGFSIASPLSIFFMQISVFLLVFVVGAMIAGIFYPNMQEWLPTVFRSRGMLLDILGLCVGLFITSGLVGVFSIGLTGGTSAQGGPSTPRDVILISAGIVIFIVIILIATQVSSGRARGQTE